MKITVGWSSYFERPDKHWWSPISDLPEAYRAPALFASEFVRVPHLDHVIVRCDEALDFATGGLPSAAADLLYLASHGKRYGPEYHVLMSREDWVPTSGAVPFRVLTLDTCELALRGVPWGQEWLDPRIGRELRLVLGFEGLASDDRGTALRGRAFAKELRRGLTFVEAWFTAVEQTDQHRPLHRRDRPIALAIGDSQADADDLLRTASLASMPGPHQQSGGFIRTRP